MMVVSPHLILDDPARDWAALVDTNGSTTSDHTLYASNRFAVNAKVNGYWDDMKRVNLHCGDDWFAGRTPLKSDWGNTLDIPTGDWSSNFNEHTTGFYCVGAAKYFDPGVDNTDVNVTNCHFFIYSGTSFDTTGTNRFYNGYLDGGNGSGFTCIGLNQTLTYDSGTTGGNGRTQAGSQSGPHGHIGGSTVSSTDRRVFRAGGQLGATNKGLENDSEPASAPRPTLLGTISYWTPTPGVFFSVYTHDYRGYTLGTGLTVAQVGDYYDDLQQFQEELGREVV